MSAAVGPRFGVTAAREEHTAPPSTVLHLDPPFRFLRRGPAPLTAWLGAQGLDGRAGAEKHVPGWVSTLTQQVGLSPAAPLGGRSGSIPHEPRTARRDFASRRPAAVLVDDVARLLLRFNVFTRSRGPRPAATGEGGWQVVVHGAENQLRFLDEIGVHGARADVAAGVARLLRASVGSVDLEPVADDVWDRVRDVLADRSDPAPRRPVPAPVSWPTPARERMARVAEVLDDSDLDVLATNDVYWDTITSIEPVGEQPVYDATVLGTHNFVADGIAAHNSLEQDADMVILLHRDDVYEKESTRPGEADLIVAKHRNGPTRDIVVAFQGHYSRFVDMAH